MSPVLDLQHLSVVRDGTTILDDVSWRVEPDQRWVVLGPNGAGKTTLLQVVSANVHPSSGEAVILGETLGRVDVFDLRPRIGFASTALARRIPANEAVLDVVMTAAYSVTGRWNEQYEEVDERRARRVLAEWRLDHLEGRLFGTLSDGEQKRVQIARAVMTDPELLLLDEPAASLDLGAREELLQLLGAYATWVSRSGRRPPRLVVVLGGFFVLTVGALGLRGVTALVGGQPVTGVENLVDFALQMPTVALGIGIGFLVAGRRWLPR